MTAHSLNRAVAVALVLSACRTRPLELAPAPPVVVAGNDAGDGSAAPSDLSPLAPADLGDGDSGTGLFQAAPVRVPLPNQYLPRSIAIADLNGDGRDDAVVGVSTQAPGYGLSVLVYLQTAAGTLAAPVELTAGSGSYESPNMLAVADLDGDSRLDLALTSYDDIRVLLQTAPGLFTPPQSLQPARTYDDSELLASGDFDGDGRADVLGVGWNETDFNVWYQAQSFGSEHDFACPHQGPNSIAVTDFDGDGTLDVAISSFNAETLCVALRPQGVFAAPTTTKLTQPPQWMAATDIDGDGRPDLLLLFPVNAGSEHLDVMHQNGDGSFTLATSLPTNPYPSGLLVADVDGDGLADAVVSHAPMLYVGIYRRLPQGGFAPEETHPYETSELYGTGPQRTAVGDLNGDGKPDIASVATSLFILYHR